MTWTILLVKKSDNGWFINYIENKLLNQIIKNKLENYIKVIVFEPNIQFSADYINVIDENLDISDNFIKEVYSFIKNSKKDCIGLKGVVYIDNGKNHILFNNISKCDNEVYLPITKLNPIKKDVIFNNIKHISLYINSNILSSIVKTIDHINNPVIFLEKITIKTPISIIVTAYKTENFIEECLDSIENQTYFINNDNFEILVGVDGCIDTYNKLQQIKSKYRNLHIYMMAENKGTYITTNTLIDLVKNEDVIRFDSDDIMTTNLVSEVIKDKKDNDIVLLGSVDLRNGQIGNKLLITEGIIYFKKSVMNNIAGGYMPWVCSADSELIRRLVNRVKISQIKKALFYRRMHSNSLTQRKDTGYNSNIRENYKKQIKKSYKDNEIKIERVINNIIEITTTTTTIKIDTVSIIITAYKTQNYIEECLDSIENQTYFKNNDNFEVLVGIDGCQNTLNKLQEIRYKYRNLKVFMMKSNKGTYVTTNTLLDLVKNENILRFDSDDVMMPNMIEEIIQSIDESESDVILSKSYDFKKSINRKINNDTGFGDGPIFFKKSILNLFGGYRDWKCGADTELIYRISNFVIINRIDKYLFYRRLHDNSLTQRIDTRYGSALREKYIKQIRSYDLNENIKINRVTNDYDEIYNIAVIMCTWKRISRLSKTIKDFQKQKYSKFDVYIWNNNYSEKDNIDNIIKNTNFKCSIYHSSINEGGFGRFLYAKEIYKKYKIIIFIDDDQIFDDNLILNFKNVFKKKTAYSWYSWKLNGSYWKRARAGHIGEADYCGTGGMMIDSGIFENEIIYQIPEKYKFIEDLWLSYIAKVVFEWKLYGINQNISIDVDNLDQFENNNLRNIKDEFWKYLINNGYRLKTDKKVKASIIISYKESNNDRKKNLKELLNYLSALLSNEIEIVLVEQDNTSKLDWLCDIKKHKYINHIFIKNDGVFNKGWGYNIGAKEAKSDYLIFNDSDMYIPINLYYSSLKLLSVFDIVNPYKNLYYLDENDSKLFVSNKYNFNIATSSLKVDPHIITGGIFLIRKEKYLALKGFDEKCYGWGAEDVIFDTKIKIMGLSVYEQNYTARHLYHRSFPRNEGDINNQLFIKNNEYYSFREVNTILADAYKKMTKEELNKKISSVEKFGEAIKQNNKKNVGLSIVMSYYNRKQLFYETIKSIARSKFKDFELIVVDDGSSPEHRLEEYLNEFPFLEIIRLDPENKWYVNPCIPFNIGIQAAVGDIIVLQNPECFHVNDILTYINENINDSNYISISTYSLNEELTSILPKQYNNLDNFFAGLPQQPTGGLKNGWYNHSKYRSKYYHFCSAITKKNMKLIGGFDERYAYGIAYDDDDFIERIKQLGLKLYIVDSVSVIHQYHPSVFYDRKDFTALHIKNKQLFEKIHKTKIV